MYDKATQYHTPTPLPVAGLLHQAAALSTRLTDAQLDRLYRCANGNTLRFEAASIVDALLAAGYAREGIGRVVTVTAKGREYLRKPAVQLRLLRLGAIQIEEARSSDLRAG